MVKAIYQTKDGKVFDTESEALEHEKNVMVLTNYLKNIFVEDMCRFGYVALSCAEHYEFAEAVVQMTNERKHNQRLVETVQLMANCDKMYEFIVSLSNNKFFSSEAQPYFEEAEKIIKEIYQTEV